MSYLEESMEFMVGIEPMASQAELENLIARQTDCIRSQINRIAELEAEVDRLNTAIAGSHDALVVLQELYSNRRNPPSVIMRAAGEAIGFERAKPRAVSNTAAVPVYDGLERQSVERCQARPAVTDAKPPAASAN